MYISRAETFSKLVKRWVEAKFSKLLATRAKVQNCASMQRREKLGMTSKSVRWIGTKNMIYGTE